METDTQKPGSEWETLQAELAEIEPFVLPTDRA